MSRCDRVQDSTPEETPAVPMEVSDAHQDMQSDHAETPPRNNGESFPPISHRYDHLESSETLSGVESPTDLNLLDATFEDAMKTMEARHQTAALPKNLQGGVLLDQTYATEPKDLNSLLYEPNSQFRRELAQQQGTTNYEESSWRWKPNDDNTCFSRCVTYTKAATKLVKAVDVIEEQVYLLADGKNFAILNRASTPDVPYGNCFQVVLLYKITPGPESSLGEKSSRLVVSWDINFHRNTVMKSVIEGTARQGFKESYESFSETLSQFIKPLSSSESPWDKDQLLEPLQSNYQSDCKLFLKYLCNFTVFSTVLFGSYMLWHILLSDLEFEGLDLPDTFCEMITGGVLALQLERVLKMISHFIRARLKRGNDHGLEGQQGDGWQLTIALIEGCRLPSASPGYPDPYVVFRCNGRSKTSSVQLQTDNPKWNDILEFGVMQEPPSVLDVKVFSFDGPFDQEIPIGHAEIKFLKHSSAELADCWVPLEGKLAQSSQSKLHLRIFVENPGGDEIIREYLQKMEKEVGKKMNPPSSHKNSTFQKLFGLPSEEFLIHEFSCCLKRKLAVQGKNFLSARIFGFYSNLFGYKTKFFFLWEDIELIQVVPPSLMAVGTPALLIILRNGRGLDARHGAKSIDDEGRLKFQFQSYKSFDRASRTIMALWRSKTCDEQQQKSENDPLDRFVCSDKSENDSDHLKACSLELPLQANVLIKVFDGGYLENKIMTKVGCVDYTATEWVPKKVNVCERKVNYKLNTHMSVLDGEVASIQQKARSADGDGWIVDEVMTIHNVPFGDHFHIHLSYRFENLRVASASARSKCEVFIGLEWVKNTKFQRRITKYVYDKVTKRSREILELVEKEIV